MPNGSCEIATTLYVNLDNNFFTAGADVTVHEFGHALGLGSHFAGFGDGAAINAEFWDALATLYGLAAGTSAAAIRVVRLP